MQKTILFLVLFLSHFSCTSQSPADSNSGDGDPNLRNEENDYGGGNDTSGGHGGGHGGGR